ncbi:hypothetical protein BH20CHL6_BH20CHL6_03960 [soil metagenome]
MHQEFLILAERAEAANGKIFIHGGTVERHYSPQFPTSLNADVAASFLVEWGETNQTHLLQIRILDQDEHEILSIEAEMTPGRPPTAKPGQDLRQLLAFKGPFPIPQAGQYKVEATIDGKPQVPPFRFWVEQAEMPGPPPSMNREQRRKRG